jgi:hypothetical protein
MIRAGALPNSGPDGTRGWRAARDSAGILGALRHGPLPAPRCKAPLNGGYGEPCCAGEEQPRPVEFLCCSYPGPQLMMGGVGAVHRWLMQRSVDLQHRAGSHGSSVSEHIFTGGGTQTGPPLLPAPAD